MADVVTAVAGKSWRTSAAGWALLLGAVAQIVHALADGNPATSPDFAALMAAASGLGLLAARDNVVSSETAGAK